jgi:hypothetical protein
MAEERGILERLWKKDSYTVGRFYLRGRIVCNTLEDKDRGLKQSDDLAYIQENKVYGQTAIPKGTYKVVFTVSEKFKNRAWAKPYGGKVPELLGVKGFSGVRVHPFNRAEESLGCISFGENKVKGQVINATKWYYHILNNYWIPAWNRGDDVILEII